VRELADLILTLKHIGRDVNEALQSEVETRPRPSKIFWSPRPSISGRRPRLRRSGPRHFSRPYIGPTSELYRPLFFLKATTTMTSSIHTIVLYNWKNIT